ncbi:MAG: hypothetical protein K8W52_08370 [Deltaproteobacteria bacterium]|nr:hypothetical protein [Deltaproteobacteria bacterium]
MRSPRDAASFTSDGELAHRAWRIRISLATDRGQHRAVNEDAVVADLARAVVLRDGALAALTRDHTLVNLARDHAIEATGDPREAAHRLVRAAAQHGTDNAAAIVAAVDALR